MLYYICPVLCYMQLIPEGEGFSLKVALTYCMVLLLPLDNSSSATSLKGWRVSLRLKTVALLKSEREYTHMSL